MNIKVGDFVKEKNLVYKIIKIAPDHSVCTIEADMGNLCTCLRNVGVQDLFSSFIKVDWQGNPISEDENPQTSWYGELTPGKENKKDEKYCYHQWQIYNGLNFSDEFCTKCGLKREIEKK